MSAAQNHPTYPVFPGKRLGQPKVSRRRGQVAAERDELQVPSVLIAVSLGAQQNTSLELIQVIAIAQNKRDDSILPGGGQIDPKLAGGGINPSLNFGIDLWVSVGHPRNGRGAYVCQLRDLVQSRLHGRGFLVIIMP